MARKSRPKQHFGLKTKIAAAKAVIAGENQREVAERFGTWQSVVMRWAEKYKAGELGDDKAAGTGAKAVKGRRHHSIETRAAAVKALLGGELGRVVAKRYNVRPSVLYAWRKAHLAGEPGRRSGRPRRNPEANAVPTPREDVDAIEGRHMTPQALFTSRVNRAIVNLRLAWKEVKRMEAERKIKGPDKAHSLAYMALLDLQGGNAL